ncbi:MAG: ribosome maturation factor RimP [Cellvibrio sp.]|nr:ribosome maturation factor RimP [Cellvibrio sp.]
MASKQDQLQALLAPVIESMGCELWGLEYLTQGRFSTLRIYIDGPNGVSLEECEKVSRQISSVMDVEDPIDGEYTLEVSSPGLDRTLFSLAHYQRYVGEVVSGKLRSPIEGRRRFKAEIRAVENDLVVMLLDNKEIKVPFTAIDKANLVPRYDELLRGVDSQSIDE